MAQASFDYPIHFVGGTISVTQGSVDVVGVGTYWANGIMPGDLIFTAGGVNVVDQVVDNYHLKLKIAWTSASASNVAYVAQRWQAHIDPINIGFSLSDLLQKYSAGLTGLDEAVESAADSADAAHDSMVAAAQSAVGLANAQNAAAASATAAGNSATSAATNAASALDSKNVSGTNATNAAASAATALGASAGITGSLDPVDFAGIVPTLDYIFDSHYVVGAEFSRLSAGYRYRATGILERIDGLVRIDHNPATGVLLGALIEDSRTNLLTYSEQFDNAIWAKSYTTVTTNAAIAPDGTQTADKLVATTDANFHTLQQYLNITAGSAVCHSMYVKAGEESVLQLYINDQSFANRISVTFNVAAGTLTAPSITGGAVHLGSGIIPVGNGWYRVWLAATVGATATIASVQDVLRGASYAGVANAGLYIWGEQAELGAFPTSYIQTLAATATRAADNLIVATDNAWYNPLEGTFYIAGIVPPAGALAFDLSDGTFNNHIPIALVGGILSAQVISGGTQLANLSTGATTIGAPFKAAISYKAGSLAASVNGAAAGSVALASVPTLNTLTIGGQLNGAVRMNSALSRIAYMPKAVTPALLQKMAA
jgi:hypothetical protein